ncbi:MULTISPECIES: hypothetical protein [unclassified Fibrobacter]|uniref:hypothetical protein n=1 Tax=unclassified Fibrobacter TaxID=2634177 RepID=UPI000D6CC27E|nr:MULTISPECIES: hypothetical protein [unclassified Fibrobacter]PWJ71773.1 hypothetical protein BGX12_1017 [Fibrobacter sp. UWR4]PZW73688.1 hypothetical protein C8E88_10027 [Fibrobacter sp. UWR1]
MSLKNELSLLAIALTILFWVGEVSARTCGTAHAIQQLHAARDNKFVSKKPVAKRAYTPCPSSDYYDTVLTQKTNHFQIFYTLTGPHQTTEAFVDTLAKAVEYAYQFHTSKMGMLPPLGNDTSFHYRMEVSEGLYPVEVIDVDLMRATDLYLGGSCHGCYGVTISEDYSKGRTTLVIDNDFRYSPSYRSTLDTLNVNGKKCIYDIADQELQNDAFGYSYADRWENGIRVTAVHELYHAVQLRYLDLSKYWTFWFEASASGVEEVSVPDIDDYFTYLPTMSKVVGTPLDQMLEDYGAGIFFLYLYNHVAKNADKFIWESFSKEPNESFWRMLQEYSQKNKLSADSLYHDFVTKLSFAGKRSSLLDSSLWISTDANRWPEFKHTFIESQTDSFLPQVDMHAYNFYNGGYPDMSLFKGRASAIAYKSNKSEIFPIKSTNAVDFIHKVWNRDPSVDSIIWVFSRMNDSILPTVPTDPTLRAYPTPWRGGDLCFTPLPQSKKFIEIRNRRGDLITRERYNTQTFCMDESQVKKLMVPGVYRFRAGSSGKTKDFIVIY